ncbi:WD40-repeat-containing domain protein [Cladochytrium replicatum]|nr:WD40-repeat-containing domain protein [Cladochytrium replicatum]
MSIFQTNQLSQKDIAVSNPPSDGVSDLSFCPVHDFLSATSWDNQTRIYEVQQNGTTELKGGIQHEAPVLSTVWSKDGTKVVSAGADKAARMLDLGNGSVAQVAAHDAPIRSVRFADTPQMQNILVTGSWDKTIKYWDLRTPNAIAVAQLPERVHTMDVAQALLVVGTADRQIVIYNLMNPTTPFRVIESPLKRQTRVVTCLPNATGFAVGSIEGRVGFQYLSEADASKNFTFRCHRDEKNVWPVNAISFHPTYGTFSTSGSDGTFSFWDKDSKQRLKQFPSVGNTIPCSAFNRTGTIFAYGSSYDWSKGHETYSGTSKNEIFLHPVKDDDVKPRQAKSGGR